MGEPIHADSRPGWHARERLFVYPRVSGRLAFTAVVTDWDGASSRAVPDARIARSRARVLATTYELLTESGLAGVTIDDIARRSGVAKTTIYRHWSDRSDLLLEACSTLAPGPAIPDTGTLSEDLRLLLRTIRDDLQQAWASVLPSIVDAAERDPLVRSLQSSLHERYAAPFDTVLRRARERDEPVGSLVAAQPVAMLIGALYYRRWFSREPLDERALEDLQVVVGALLNTPAKAADGAKPK